MKLIHSADQHQRSAKQYGSQIRIDDFKTSIVNFVESVLSLQPDFVTFGGDLFDTPTPTYEIREHVRSCLLLLQYHNIPVYCIDGNHDSAAPGDSITISTSLSKESIMTHVGNMKVLHDKKTDTLVWGLNWAGDDTQSKIEKIIEESQKINHSKNILISHSAIKQYGPYDPSSFDPSIFKDSNICLVLLGHHHVHYIHKESQTTFISPGSLEICSISELGKNNGYSEITIDDGNNVDVVQHVTKKRDFVIVDIDISQKTMSNIIDIAKKISLSTPSVLRINLIGESTYQIDKLAILDQIDRTYVINNSAIIVDRTHISFEPSLTSNSNVELNVLTQLLGSPEMASNALEIKDLINQNEEIGHLI